MNVVRAILLCMSLFFWEEGMAQPYVSNESLAESAAPSAIGITILSNPSLSIKSTSDYQNGVSIDHSTLQLNVSLGLSWSIQVRATGDLQYQNQSIPISSIGLQSVNLGNRPELFLSTNNQTLSSGLASSALNVVNVIRYRAVGGSNFLKPAGNYTTTLIFTFTAN